MRALQRGLAPRVDRSSQDVVARPSGPVQLWLQLMAGSSVVAGAALGLTALGAALLGDVFAEEAGLVDRRILVIAGILLGVFVMLWSGWSWLYYLPIRDALRLRPEQLMERENLARAAYKRLYQFPTATAAISMAMWGFGALIAGLIILANSPLWFRLVISASLVLIGIGINLPQFYVYKRILDRSVEYVRSLAAGLYEEDAPIRRPISQKLRIGFVGTLFFALGFSFIIQWLNTERIRAGDLENHLLSLRSMTREMMQSAGARGRADSEWLQDLLASMATRDRGGGFGYIVFDEQTGDLVAKRTDIEIDADLRQTARAARGAPMHIPNRELTALSLDTTNIPGVGVQWLVTFLIERDRSGNFVIRMMVVYGLTLLLSLVMAWLIAQDLLLPLRTVVRRTGRVARGRLDTYIPVGGEDEIGDLSMQMREMVGSLNRMVANLRDASEQVTSATGKIVQSSRETVEASTAQADQTLQTEKSIESLNERIEGIVREVQSLHQAVETSSAAAFQLAATAKSLRETSESMEAESDAIAGSTDELGRTIEIIATGIEKLREAGGRAREAIAEIDSSIAEVRGIVSHSEKASTEMLNEARSGRSALEEALEGIRRVEQSVNDALETVRSLGQKNSQIAHILDVINTVADQTSLLSFNAAIIAAQAGEHGRSFAVVADEIRKLADQTSASTGEIASLISSITRQSHEAIRVIEVGVGEVSRGRELTTAAGEALERITNTAESSLEGVRHIAQAMDAQRRQSEVVVQVVERLGEQVEQFVRTEGRQREGGRTIVKALERIQNLSKQLSRAAAEQKRAAEEVSRGISQVQATMESVMVAVEEEALEAERIGSASKVIRELAQANAEKARHLEIVSARLNEQAGALRGELTRFEL